MIANDISNSIDIIRGMAALCVIWGHSVYGFDLPLELNGAFWVWVFLPISGYLIGKGFIDGRYELNLKGYKKFIFNRGLRIIPLYQVAMLLGIFIEKIGDSEKTSMINLIKQFTFSTYRTTLAGPLWTVVAEIHFYIVSIVVIGLIIKFPNKIFLAVLLLFSFGIAGFYNGIVHGYFAQPRTLIGNFHFFVFGMALSTQYFQKLWVVSRNCKVFIVIILVVIAWYIANWHPEYFWRFGNSANKFLPLGGASSISLIVAVLILSISIKENVFDTRLWLFFKPLIKFFGWCGFYTYGIYVWHSVLVALNNSVLSVPLGLSRLAFLLLAIPIAVMSYRFIESPILKFKID